MIINTMRFGKLEIDDKRVVHFPDGLLGFPEVKDYAILSHNPGSPFLWLQSVSRADLAFVMVEAFAVKEGYLKDLPFDIRTPIQNEKKKIDVFALVTISRDEIKQMTVNLLGPIVIDVENRTGRQVILERSGYSHRHPLMTA